MSEPAAYLRESRRWVEEVLDRCVPALGSRPAALHEALRYALFGGGKRLRPAIVRLVAREFGGRDADAELPAVAIECVHTYSLVHDDLPCMDDDDLRRGRPTVHVVYGEALGVLVGDALQALAFELLAGPGDGRAAAEVSVLAAAAGPAGMVGGQVLDLASTGVPRPGEVEEIHLCKTAALFGAAAELGAVAAGAGSAEREGARSWGVALGRVFQAVDFDLLDVTGDAATLGKTPGKDARLERTTLVAALGLAGARAEAQRLGEELRRAGAELGWGPESTPAGLADLLLARKA